MLPFTVHPSMMLARTTPAAQPSLAVVPRLVSSLMVHGGLVLLAVLLGHAVLQPVASEPTMDMIFEAPPRLVPQIAPEPDMFDPAIPAEPAPPAPPLVMEALTEPPPALPVTPPPPALAELAPVAAMRPAIPKPLPKPEPRLAARIVPPRPMALAVPQQAPLSATSQAMPARSAPAAAAPPVIPTSVTAPPITAVSSSWRSALLGWLRRPKPYPDDARRRSTEGQVTLRITVAASGDVLAQEVQRSSGSDTLDQAALAVVRGARVPPFPPDMTQSRVTMTVGITYRLEE